MNITELTNKIVTIASSTPFVGSAAYGDVYEIWNTKDVRYGAVCVGYESFTITEPMMQVSAIIYYGDRLTNDRTNETECYDDGVHVLTSILNELGEDVDVSVPVFNLFEQKFADELAGVYARVTISFPYDLGGCAL